MADKPLWRRIGDKATDKLVEWLVGAALAGLLAWLLLARRWTRNEWTCIKKPWCEVEGWSLGLLIVFALAMTVAAVYLGIRLYRTPRGGPAQTVVPDAARMRVYLASQAPFHKITVEDQRLKLRWFIRRPPKEWLEWRNIQSTFSPEGVHQVLDGPFHAKPDCNAPLGEQWIPGPSGGYPVFEETCPSCGDRIFRSVLENGLIPRRVRVFTARAQVLEELQRMERGPEKPVLDGAIPVVLKRPAYWKDMLPP